MLATRTNICNPNSIMERIQMHLPYFYWNQSIKKAICAAVKWLHNRHFILPSTRALWALVTLMITSWANVKGQVGEGLLPKLTNSKQP